MKRRPPIPPSGKRRGGQPGHHRRVRALVPPEQVRQLVVCKPTHCRGCGGDLQGDDPEPLRHQVAELPPVLPVVDEYQLHRLACPRCRVRTCGTLPPGVPTGAFGPRLRAVLSVLVGAYRLGKRPVQQLVFDRLGLSISLGMISRLERQAPPSWRPRSRNSAGMFVTPPRLTSTRRRGGKGGPRPGSGRP